MLSYNLGNYAIKEKKIKLWCEHSLACSSPPKNKTLAMVVKCAENLEA